MSPRPPLNPDLVKLVRLLARVHAERDFKARLAKRRDEGRQDAA